MPRTPVTRDRLEEFLRRLGRDFHGTGRLYLVGGAQMVQAGFRLQTQDVDYTIQLAAVDQEAFSIALHRLIRELDMNIEPAGPGDFIPLPSGWETRSPFLGRYGGLDVFAFDPVSTALAKVERGTTQDIDDVLALLAAGRFNVADLGAAFEEILPRLERESIRADEADFRRKFAAFVRLALAHPPTYAPPDL
jgi:hypothetical protein